LLNLLLLAKNGCDCDSGWNAISICRCHSPSSSSSSLLLLLLLLLLLPPDSSTIFASV
jgi:hypothetical protein